MSLAMPSIHPHRGFNANQDAEVLRGAMKGLGCNNSKIVAVLCARSNVQRQDIEKAYKAMYGRFLIDDLKSELSGDFEELILALMEPSALYDAKLMRKAMQGLGTNENLMVEVLCTRDNDQIACMKAAYTKEFGKDMERDVMSETSGDFKRLMISLLAGGRDQSYNTDHLRANQDAHKLYKAGEGRLGTDESAFNCVLASQNFAQLNMVFNEYEKIRGHSLEQALTSEFGDDVLHAYQTIVAVVRSRPGYLAKQINEAMKSLQFRLLENKLGVRPERRIKYNSQHYKNVFGTTAKADAVASSEEEPSLLQLIQNWLERTPGLKQASVDGEIEEGFWPKYETAVEQFLADMKAEAFKEGVTDRVQDQLLAEYFKTCDSFQQIIDPKKHEQQIINGSRLLSHDAMKGALMIYFYRDMPRFSQPYQILTYLMDIDSLFQKWRYNHVILVQRMLGSKQGTEGSSGYLYLRSTVSDKYKVFLDLFNLSTWLIPREYIPSLSARMVKTLSEHSNLSSASMMSTDTKKEKLNGCSKPKDTV